MPNPHNNRGDFETNVTFLKCSGYLHQGVAMLEIGSGRGQLANFLQDRGYQITGSEVHDGYIDYARTTYGIELVKLTGTALPFADNSFKVVISFDVFEHIPDSDTHLQEVHRVLAPDGVYLMGVPNKVVSLPFSVIAKRSLSAYRRYHPSLHTYWGLRRRLQRNQFTATFVSLPAINDFVRAKVKRYFGRVGELLLRVVNFDVLPLPLKPHFYLVARKDENA